MALVRASVYGNYRYTPEPYRHLIPYDLFAQEDGNFRENVIVTPKGSPMDWDLSAPIPALDGAIQKNLSGSELVIDKGWPISWIEKWKWWLQQDNYRSGPGSLNKFDVDCIMGVSMIEQLRGPYRQSARQVLSARNMLVAVGLAGMHLLPAAQPLEMNTMAMCLVLAVATGAGVLFGWVYWRYGLLLAMFTHAIANLLVYLGMRGLVAWAG